MFPLDISYLRPNLGDDNRLYWRHLGYINKVLGIEYSDLILYHPMFEASGSVANDQSQQNNDGAYTGVTLGQAGIGDGQTCPLFDGANDYNNLYSVGFRDDFDGGEGTISLWARVSGAGVWTDGASRRTIGLQVDGNNQIAITKLAANNTLRYFYAAGGTQEQIDKGSVSAAGWMHFALTWSATDDEVKAYYNGVQEGSTKTALGTWVGNLAATTANVGAAATTPTTVWDGRIAHPAVWKKTLTLAQIANLATV